MRTLVIGDIHGAYKALLQCLERSKFDYETDRMICLGDVVDSWPDVPKCFDELAKMKNLIYIIGNHDYWALQWYGQEKDYMMYPEPMWIKQGGRATFDAYGPEGMPIKHLNILRKSYPAMEEEIKGVKRLYVHGGINPNKAFEKQDPENCMWDRQLFMSAHDKHYQKRDLKFGGYDDIFIGHTTTQHYSNELKPLHYCNVWNLDTGGGWSGKVTIMDSDTKEYWQSDLVGDLYPDIANARR